MHLSLFSMGTHWYHFHLSFSLSTSSDFFFISANTQLFFSFPPFFPFFPFTKTFFYLFKLFNAYSNFFLLVQSIFLLFHTFFACSNFLVLLFQTFFFASSFVYQNFIMLCYPLTFTMLPTINHDMEVQFGAGVKNTKYKSDLEMMKTTLRVIPSKTRM